MALAVRSHLEVAEGNAPAMQVLEREHDLSRVEARMILAHPVHAKRGGRAAVVSHSTNPARPVRMGEGDEETRTYVSCVEHH